MIRVRNIHPTRPLQCSRLILLPGQWHEVSEAFREAHGGVPELEFQEVVASPAEPPAAAPSAASPAEPDSQRAAPSLREWALANGWPEVKDGRRKVSQDARDAYAAAFPGS